MRATPSDLPIRFERATVRAGGRAILDTIDMTFNPGAPTLLIGPNGSGKTTLLRLAMGLIPSNEGRVTWGGREHVAPIRRAIVFQRPSMLRRSAAANIEYALASAGVPRTRWKARVAELLELVGLSEFADRSARQLSGGEQQRLAVARALGRSPEVLFLDEPTAALDPAATKAIEDVVRTVAAQNIKIVMSTHDLGEARRLAGDVVLLHRGRIIESSASPKFFSNPTTEAAQRFLAGELLL